MTVYYVYDAILRGSKRTVGGSDPELSARVYRFPKVYILR